MKAINNIILVIVIIAVYSITNKLYSQNDNDQNDIFTIVETSPEFPGGDNARIDFLTKNISYPKSAREAGIEGTVYVTFVVETDGNISNIKILRGIGGGCNEETTRVVRLMPKWKPGQQRGKNVRVQFNMPLKYTLTDEKEKKEKDTNNKQSQ